MCCSFWFPNSKGDALGRAGRRLLPYFCFPKAKEEIRQCWYIELAALPTILYLEQLPYSPGIVKWQVKIRRWLVSTPAVFLRKEDCEVGTVRLHQNLKGSLKIKGRVKKIYVQCPMS
jgi:hypothetical protein